jgi:hypothetical protein
MMVLVVWLQGVFSTHNQTGLIVRQSYPLESFRELENELLSSACEVRPVEQSD